MLIFLQKCLIGLLCFITLFSPSNVLDKTTATQDFMGKKPYIIVIDAGHGGKDKGTRGLVTNIYESDLNLEYSKTLEQYFKEAGMTVVQTRKNKQSLNENPSLFHKKQDMEARKKIIETANPDLVISVHMNEFLADKRQRGAQVFYLQDDKNSENLSECVQAKVNETNKRSRIQIASDFYILKCANCPSILVECGFLSNYEEEKVLQTKEYKELLCKQIFLGVMQYLLSYS